MCYAADMSEMKALTLRLDGIDYDRLSGEAQRLGVEPGALAQSYVRAALAGSNETEAERARRTGLEALDRLIELTADLPPVDAARIAAEGRADLVRRSAS